MFLSFIAQIFEVQGHELSAIVTTMNLGPPELLIILIIVVVLFGGAKLPKLARSIGQAQKEFQEGMKEGAIEDEEETSS